MACLHLSEYQVPLCRGCETGSRIEALVFFYQRKEGIYQLLVSSEYLDVIPISYACENHISQVRNQLESILEDHIRQGRQPRWKFHIW